MSDIKECAIIKQLNNDLLQQIKFVYIFYGGKSIICVTIDDNVYSCGDNHNGYRGLGHERPIETPTLIEELCKKQVIAIYNTCVSLTALTKTGMIYTWGLNTYGQLGNGTKDQCFKPVIINGLIGINIIDIKCGLYHCLALTQNGEVFEWGWSVTEPDNTIPFKVNGLLLHTITQISCGEYHSLVLADNGEVFSWGWNDCGQCGVDNNITDCQILPIKVENLTDIKISAITCQPSFNVLLSENGDIYVFGKNEFLRFNNSIPTKLSISTKFVDIRSQIDGLCILIGLSIDGFCYFMGECDDGVIEVPKKTQFTDIDEAFANITKYEYRTYYFKNHFENITATERFKKSFNDKDCSDISFKIDGKYICVQKLYLKTVCKHFEAMFADNVWLESNAKQVEITQYSYSVYYAFLKYLYTDSVDIQSKYLIDLYNLADSYIEENLKQKCIELMKNTTNVNNVYTFYSFAVNKNFDKLEKYFYDYMINYLSDVFKTDAYIQSNEISILKKFVNTSLINGKLP